ncbi:peptidoglycan-binding domain-containing protein [Hyalangium versicolor]|uniref:peptidoglycan-binding domain-containing protein n=1 Tax=Hyalangium versicolor TaxID=2861190 RepID=UPI001CCF8655|nr:peptidoglycan-binding protein [Hyalangium versicolor]
MSVGGANSSRSSSGSMAAGRAADRSSVSGYSADSRTSKSSVSSKSSGSMAAARAADRASVKGYSAESSFSKSGSMAAARAADRASVAGYTSGSLRKGAATTNVRDLQDRLRSAGFNPGKTDGKFGRNTEKAVRDFQRSMGLKADGVVGPRTFEALNGTSRFTQKTKTPATTQSTTTGRPYEAMSRLAQQHGLTVTSTTGGKHNTGSKHYQGRAIDVRTRGVSEASLDAFMADARANGYTVRDERTRPAGQKVWGGAHIHIEK